MLFSQPRPVLRSFCPYIHNTYLLYSLIIVVAAYVTCYTSTAAVYIVQSEGAET